MRGHLHEGRERVDAVLAMAGVGDLPALHAEALEAAGGISYWMADWATGADRYGECLEIRRNLPDASATAEAAYNLACIATYGPEPFRSVERADELLAEALTIFRELDDRRGLAKVLWASAGTSSIRVRPTRSGRSERASISTAASATASARPGRCTCWASPRR